MKKSRSLAAEKLASRAVDLRAQGRNDNALELLAGARRDFPHHGGIARQYADMLHTARRHDEAIDAYHSALKLESDAAPLWYGLGCVHLVRKEYGAAAKALKRSVGLRPADEGARINLGQALYHLGHVEAAVDQFRHASRSTNPQAAAVAHSNIACIIMGSSAADNAAVLRARQDWVSLEEKKLAALQRSGRAEPAEPHPATVRKLRIGYLSAFFGARNWMKPVWALINRHDRSRFEVHLFSDGDNPAAESGYHDEPRDQIHVIRGIDNASVASIVSDIGIDVLVDLNGYSYQRRLTMLMRKPAPVQVGWFNMFATTGMPVFDWLVGDDVVIPPSEEKHYAERIFRLPGTYLAFEVLYPVPDVVPPPCRAPGSVAGGIAFGSLGSQYKLTDVVIAAWARILREVPAATLFIKNGALEDRSVRDDLLKRFLERGVEASRLTLEGRSEHYEFLRAYDRIDIALDTFPYNGGTTTTEALWQGVPVFAFNGDRWAARTSATLLTAAGLQEWVLPDANAYVESAIALATDPATPQRLADLRLNMRHHLRQSAACDAAGMCRAMENFYETVAGGEA